MCTLDQPGIIAANVGRRYVNAYIILEQLQGLFFFICSVSKTACNLFGGRSKVTGQNSKKLHSKKVRKIVTCKIPEEISSYLII